MGGVSTEIIPTHSNIISLSGALNKSRFARLTTRPALRLWSGQKGEEVKRQFIDRETESRQTDRHRQQGCDFVTYVSILRMSLFSQPGHKARVK